MAARPLLPRPLHRRHLVVGALGLGCGLVLGRLLPPSFWLLGLLGLGFYLLREPRYGRSRLVRGGGFLLLGALLSSLTLLVPGAVPRPEGVTHYRSTPQQAEAWAGVQRLVVRNSAGPLEVSGGEALELSARYIHGAAAWVPGDLLASYGAGVLNFTGVEPSLPQAARRGVRAQLRVRAPRQVALDFSGRLGDVRAERLAAVRINTNIGDVSVREVSGPVVVSTDVGNVVVTESPGATEVNTRVGDIWLEPEPGPAPILAQADTGNITLVLPENADVRVIATSLSRGLPPGWPRGSPTQSEKVFGQGTRFVVLGTRLGQVRVVSR